MPDFTDIFGEDFEEILKQLDNLSPEQELLLLGIIEKAAVQAEIIELQIQQELATMISNGMTRTGAEMAIKVDLKKGGALHNQPGGYKTNEDSMIPNKTVPQREWFGIPKPMLPNGGQWLKFALQFDLTFQRFFTTAMKKFGK